MGDELQWRKQIGGVRHVPAVVDVFLACTIAVWFVLELRESFHHRHQARQAHRGSLGGKIAQHRRRRRGRQVRRARTAGPVSGWARAAT